MKKHGPTRNRAVFSLVVWPTATASRKENKLYICKKCGRSTYSLRLIGLALLRCRRRLRAREGWEFSNHVKAPCDYILLTEDYLRSIRRRCGRNNWAAERGSQEAGYLPNGRAPRRLHWEGSASTTIDIISEPFKWARSAIPAPLSGSQGFAFSGTAPLGEGKFLLSKEALC